MGKAGTMTNFTYRADGLRARKEVGGGLTIDCVYDGQVNDKGTGEPLDAKEAKA